MRSEMIFFYLDKWWQWEDVASVVLSRGDNEGNLPYFIVDQGSQTKNIFGLKKKTEQNIL